MYFDVYFMPEPRPLCGDFRIFAYFYPARKRDAPFVRNTALVKLFDKNVALKQEGCSTERQVELSRSQAFRTIRPADMVSRNLRAVDDDAI